MFFYLYLDVWSRKIVGFRVAEVEDGQIASQLLEEVCSRSGVCPAELVVHQDNGSPMKGATFKATMDKLGVTPSFSRPRVSDDNPFSEALFRTMKYVPEYPTKPFVTIEEAIAWVTTFVSWYNHHHLHSGIGYVTPVDRHAGSADDVLEHRRTVYEAARRRNPERWSGSTRAWNAPNEVILNPTRETRTDRNLHAIAA